LGAVIIPVLMAARIPPLTIGSALLLGSSVGGELLNPGAPELRTIVEESERAAHELGQPSPGLTGAGVVARILPLNLLGLAVATVGFWILSLRGEGRRPSGEGGEGKPGPPAEGFRVNVLLALIPLLPLILLFLTSPPLKVVEVPTEWLVEPPRGGGPLPAAARGLFDSRLIGAAMLIGVVVAALAVPRKA